MTGNEDGGGTCGKEEQRHLESAVIQDGSFVSDKQITCTTINPHKRAHRIFHISHKRSASYQSFAYQLRSALHYVSQCYPKGCGPLSKKKKKKGIHFGKQPVVLFYFIYVCSICVWLSFEEPHITV